MDIYHVMCHYFFRETYTLGRFCGTFFRVVQTVRSYLSATHRETIHPRIHRDMFLLNASRVFGGDEWTECLLIMPFRVFVARVPHEASCRIFSLFNPAQIPSLINCVHILILLFIPKCMRRVHMLICSSYVLATQVRPTCRRALKRTRTNIPQHIPSAHCAMSWTWRLSWCISFLFVRFPSNSFCSTQCIQICLLNVEQVVATWRNDGFAMRFSRLPSSRLCRSNE